MKYAISYVSLILALTALVATSAMAEGPLGFGPTSFTDDMETDRPDFTESTQTIDPGHLQIEAGYTFSYDDDTDATSQTIPELLARVGLLDDLELRVAWAGYIREELEDDQGGETVNEGGADLSFGVKKDLYPQYLVIPKTAMILACSVPVGGDEVSANDAEPEFKLLLSYELPKDLAVSGNLNAKSPVEDDQRFFELSASLSLSYPLPASFDGYLEYFGFYPNSDAPDDSSTHYLNTGVTYPLSDALQLDVRVGAGLNSEAQDFFTGIGVAFRL